MKNYKKALTSILTLTLIAGALAFNNSVAFAESNESVAETTINTIEFPDTLPTSGTYIVYDNSDSYEINWTFSNGYLAISSAKEYPNGYTVSDISNFFEGANEYVIDITINENAAKIHNYAFSNMENLESVHLPETLTYIGDSAFYNCTDLTAINIPDTVSSIGNSAFYNCTGLTEINIPNSATSIGNFAFYNCIHLATISIPDNVTSIGDGAFSTCTNLSSINIPDNIVSIGSSAFYSCINLTSINIPSKLTSINAYTFYNCTGLNSINIPDNITSIGDEAFSYCGNLASINIPNNLTSIGNSTFSSCVALKTINIPENVTSIGNSAFSSCEGLTAINIPDSVTFIGNSAFYKCTNLTSINIPENVTSIGYSVFSYCTALTSINIPDSVTSIGEYAFSNCNSLNSINIPDSVTSISSYAFGFLDKINLFFGGNAPTFGTKAFSRSDVTAYYPTGNTTWNSVITNEYRGNTTYIACNPLKITKHPANVIVESGAKATVSLTATGENVTYKWYSKNPGATKFSYTSTFKSNTYSVQMDSTRSGRQVYCVVTDKYGNSIKSKTVTLKMGNFAKITKQPTNAAAANGSKATVNLTAVGDGLTYKWYFKNSGAAKFSYTSSFSSNTYSVLMDGTRSGRQIYCVVTDKYGSSVQSNTVTLNMGNPAKITRQPINVTAANGSKATVSVAATGDGLTYKWYIKNPGATKFSYTSTFKSNTYSVLMDGTRSGRQIYCVITDKYGNSIQSNTVTLKMS